MHTKIDAEMTHLEKKNIDLAIRQKLRKKYVYETYSYKMSPTYKQLQEKAASDATFQAVKTGQHPIGYLMIPNKVFFSNQYEEHPIRSLCLVTRLTYNTVHHVNYNINN